jgi:ADP-ribose pyrophosphatase
VTSTRTTYEGIVARIRLDEVVMPGGRTAVREVVEHVPAVAVAAVDDEDRVVLVEQYRHPLGRRLWELPAGLMDIDGEHAVVAARRELAEETGIAASSWSVLVDLATSPGFCTEMVRVYLARGLTEVGREIPHGDEESDLRIVRVSLSEAVAAVLDGRIVNGSTVAGVLAAARVLSADSGGGAEVAPRDVDAPWPA